MTGEITEYMQKAGTPPLPRGHLDVVGSVGQAASVSLQTHFAPVGTAPLSRKPDPKIFDALHAVSGAEAWRWDPDPVLTIPYTRRSGATRQRFVMQYSPIDEVLARTVKRAAKAAPPARAKRLSLRPSQIRAVEKARLATRDSVERRAHADRFQLLRQWDCHVVEAAEGYVVAAAVTKRGGWSERRVLRIPQSLLRPQDQELAVEGALFFYCVGRFVGRHGHAPGSQVWFRRVPTLEMSDEELLAEGQRLSEQVAWDT